MTFAPLRRGMVRVEGFVIRQERAIAFIRLKASFLMYLFICKISFRIYLLFPSFLLFFIMNQWEIRLQQWLDFHSIYVPCYRWL